MTVGENVGLPLRKHTETADAEIRKRVADRLSGSA